MRATQQIFRIRREYNIWVGNETLEDYALRFTAKKARRWTVAQVAKTALGATAFMALEAIAASLTLSYGFTNTFYAILTVAVVIFVTGLPITYYAAKHGLDIDLLTRGAGFGYMGSTITSLIYASFTFIFFAIEAVILASALKALLGIPLPVGYVLCAVAVVPIVTHGITAISKFQLGSQWTWLSLQCLALGIVVWFERGEIGNWSQYVPAELAASDAGQFNLVLFGACCSILFAMMAQIGEQVDYLRFMPEKTRENRRQWWFWLLLAGPGWVVIGVIKMLFGSFLAYLAISRGGLLEDAIDPTRMYQMAFGYLTQSPGAALLLASIMVVISQMKINVTNAYAGSIAWSNFFSRMTHSHPGRVVWLVFNVVIALILMELGIYRALESILGVFAIVAVSWLGCLSADLMINKPLGLSPSFVEFKRAHLYDINPVGVVSVLLASALGVFSYMGLFGETLRHLSHFVSLAVCFVSVPVMALLTRSRYYLARQSPEIERITTIDAARNHPVAECSICENHFETEDLSWCPAYQGTICSLCCSLDSRCMDVCKPGARFSQQIYNLISPVMPTLADRLVNSRLAKFLTILFVSNLIIAILLSLMNVQMQPQTAAEAVLLKQTLVNLFFILLIVSGVLSWVFLLAHESQEVAQQESTRQTQLLMQEIEAHKETDQKLQQAKETAERANQAKSRYLSGISHELRTPLQSILGYTQLLGNREDIPAHMQNALKIIRRNGEHLSGLIEGLLDISRIEAGRLEIYRNVVNLPELIDQVVSMFQAQATAKGIEFNCHISGTLPDFVITDEKRLQQILFNLISNAIKYTEVGSVDLNIRYRNQVALFSVRDTGCGIEPGDLKRIMEPFERVRRPNQPYVHGTGLGLTIVKLLVDIMGGDLRISSEPGTGSTFTVQLMFSWVDHPAPVEFRRITGYKGKPRMVIVVDDEPTHRQILTDLLSPKGFICLEAADAEQCLSLVREQTPDLFLLDVGLPGMDGIALTRELRELGYEQPVVMISAEAEEQPGKTLGRPEYDDYLVKPVNHQKLLDTLARLLKLEWVHAPAATGRENRVSVEENDATQPVVIPDHPLIHSLLDHARIGYRRGVSDTLRQIDQLGLLNVPTARLLHKLSNELGFADMASLLESELDDTTRIS